MQKPTVLIGGGRGFVGRSLVNLLRENNLLPVVLSRESAFSDMTWDNLESHGLPPNCDAVVNLCGAQFLTFKRWTDKLKREVTNSRVGTTTALVEAIKQAQVKPQVYIGITAVGYYEPNEVTEYTEGSKGGDYDYFSNLVTKWEMASEDLSDVGVRRVIIRSGVVLGRGGGIIKQMYWPFYFGLGGTIGSGKQWFPWIHLADLIGLITHSIINPEISGILNGTSPEPCTNAEFTQAFAKSLNRPAFLPTPPQAMKIIFGEERARVVLEGQKVLPKRTLETGYKFLYPNIKDACGNLYTGFV